MIFPFFRRGPRGPDTISTLYGMIVAQARLPSFYRDYAVADTVNGRFDLIVLHLALVLDRLMPDAALQGLGQGIFDRFCQDMDHNLREMGVSDLKVPKQMRQIGEAFYGCSRAYKAAWTEHGRCGAGASGAAQYLWRVAGQRCAAPCGLYAGGVTWSWRATVRAPCRR